MTIGMFLWTLGLFLLAFAGLATGVLLRRPGLRRTCSTTGEVCSCPEKLAQKACDCH